MNQPSGVRQGIPADWISQRPCSGVKLTLLGNAFVQEVGGNVDVRPSWRTFTERPVAAALSGREDGEG